MGHFDGARSLRRVIHVQLPRFHGTKSYGRRSLSPRELCQTPDPDATAQHGRRYGQVVAAILAD